MNTDIDKDIFRKEILASFDNNITKCAIALGLEMAHLHKFLRNEHSRAGAKLIGALYSYCEHKGLDFKRFIILPNPSTIVYGDTEEDGGDYLDQGTAWGAKGGT